MVQICDAYRYTVAVAAFSREALSKRYLDVSVTDQHHTLILATEWGGGGGGGGSRQGRRRGTAGLTCILCWRLRLLLSPPG